MVLLKNIDIPVNNSHLLTKMFIFAVNNTTMGAINYLEIENEVAELGNALHMLKAYEKDGNLDFDEIVEDQEFGTFENLNDIYMAAKNLVEKITALC